MAYTKLFSSILDSSIWCEPHATRIVWITLLAMADRDGVVEASVSGLARRAGVTRDEAELAINKFLAPDPDSRTPTHEGRRIQAAEGGWLLLNFEAYRDKASAEERAEKSAARSKRYRERHASRGTVTGHAPNASVTQERDAVTPTVTQERDASRAGDASSRSSRDATRVTHSDQNRSDQNIGISDPDLTEPARDPDLLPPQVAAVPRLLREGYERRYFEALAAPPGWTEAASRHIATVAAWVVRCASARKVSPERVVERLLERFFADPNAGAKRYPLGFLAHDPGQYLDAGKTQGSGGVSAARAKLDEALEQAIAAGDLDAQDRLRGEIRDLGDRARAAKRGQA